MCNAVTKVTRLICLRKRNDIIPLYYGDSYALFSLLKLEKGLKVTIFEHVSHLNYYKSFMLPVSCCSLPSLSSFFMTRLTTSRAVPSSLAI